MIKNLLLATLITIGTPTPKGALYFEKTYYKALTSQKTQNGTYGSDPTWERLTIYDYGNIGQNTLNGIDVSMRQIEYVYTRIYSSYERILVENYYYIEIKTNGNIFNGDAIFNSITNYIPENWSYVLYQKAYMTYETGYNIADYSTNIYSITPSTSIDNATTTLDTLLVKINASDNGWYINNSGNSTQTAMKNQVFGQINQQLIGGGYEYNYTRGYQEEIGYIMHTAMEASGNYTNSQESSYININENAVNSIAWHTNIEDAISPTPTPTPTPDGYEVVDLPGLMFTVLGLPFAWMSTAFNLTIYPGTPYEVNFGYLFLGIVGLLIIIFIIRKLLKG